MQILKLENNLYQELNPEAMPASKEWKEGDSVFRKLETGLSGDAGIMWMEKRKYPYFYKYYLYLGEGKREVSLRSEEGIRFVISFYKKYCPDYVKKDVYDAEVPFSAEDYFYMERVQGEAMQHFVPGKGLVEELEEEKEKADVPSVSGKMDGYHEFTEEEKQDIGGQLDALKSQFADQLKDLEALLGKKV